MDNDNKNSLPGSKFKRALINKLLGHFTWKFLCPLVRSYLTRSISNNFYKFILYSELLYNMMTLTTNNSRQTICCRQRFAIFIEDITIIPNLFRVFRRMNRNRGLTVFCEMKRNEMNNHILK